MKHRMTRLGGFTLSALVVLGVSACSLAYEDVTVQKNGKTLDVTGVIDADTVETISVALADSPEITTLRLVNVPGSADDEASLNALVALVKDNNLATRVPANGLVASGGTDMAVMSKNRVIEKGACVGVHSWAIGNLFGFDSGADLPRSDEAHDLYLDFYETVNVPASFYWFTLEAASPEGMHWMSAKEINRFNLSKVRLDETPTETAAEREARCNALVF